MEKMDTNEQKDPLSLDAITERRLVAAFLDFLKTKAQKADTSEAAKESLEVTRQCLMQAFGLTDDRVEILRPQITLLDIFSSHPDATPANPRQVLESELKNTPAASADAKNKADEFKNKGNEFMKSNEVDHALQAYTEAINLDPTNPILYCNRAAAFSKKNQHDLAAKDCEIALAFDSNYAKAYGRYGLALHGLGLLKDAKEALEKAVSLDPENQLYKNNLKLVEDTINATGGADQSAGGQLPGGFPGMPGMPAGMFDMLQNQDFQATMMQMMQNPQVQQMVGQFSSMFLNQMGGAPGAAGAGGIPPNLVGGAPGGLPPNLDELFHGGIPGMEGMTPEQMAEQMRGLFGGMAPPGGAPDSHPKPEDKDKSDKGPGSGAGGTPSYFS